MVTLNAIVNMKVSTLVFSTDSDDLTIASRLIAITTGRTTESAEQWMAQSPHEAAKVLEPYRHKLKWNFHPNPSLDDIWLEAYAYLEIYGQWPEMIVLDILSDVTHGGADEWGALREVMRQAKVLARETGAAVLLVHHCTDAVAKGKVCPSRSDVMGKVSMQPILMLTFGKDAGGNYWVACVKNRFGPSDASGEARYRMALNAATSTVGDWVEAPWGTRGEEWSDG